MKNGILTLSRRRQNNNKTALDVDSNCDDLNSIDEGSVVSNASTDTTLLDDSLHVSSLHKSSSLHSAGSDYDNSFNSSIGISWNSSIRSRSKGTKKTSLKRKHVSFNDNKITWTIVESYKGYSADLWWSKDEVKQRQIDMNQVLFEYSQEELGNIRQYTNAYHNARKKSIVSKHHNNDSIDLTSKSKINLSNEDYKSIVRGKANGWDGLEKVILSSSKSTTSMTRQSIVQTILNSYYDMKYKKINQDSISSSQNKNNDPENRLRSLSKSLTSSDRSWAVVMGNADRDALSLRQSLPLKKCATAA